MSHIRRSANLLMLLVAAAFITAMVWKTPPPPKYAGLTAAEVPSRVGEFLSRGDYEMSPEVKATLASQNVVSRSYSDGANAVDFVLISGTDRRALHDPRTCLTGGGWQLRNDRTERLPGTDVMVRSCQLVGAPGAGALDILYLYVVDGRVINKPTEIRAKMLWTALIGRKNRPVHFLRFIQPVGANSEAAAADHARLQRFAARMWTALGPGLVRANGKGIVHAG
jgi:EpsI family protein